MSREKRPWDCHQTLKAVKGAFYGGMGALAVNLLLLYIVGEQTWMPALTVIYFVMKLMMMHITVCFILLP